MDNFFNPDTYQLSEPGDVFFESEGRELFGLRYDYVAIVLENEFEETYLRFFSSSILHYELINLVTLCTPVMNDFGFPKNEDSRFLRYSIIAAIAEYLGEGGDDGI